MPNKVLGIDFETFSTVDIVKCGSYKYMEDPEFEILLMAYAYDDEDVVVLDLTAGERPPMTVMFDLYLTAYCPCTYCCGEWADGITATGVKAQANHTIAVDPDVIPLGSWVLIGKDWFKAEDTGAFCGNIIDIYFDSHEEAKDFGRQTAVVYVDVREEE